MNNEIKEILDYLKDDTNYDVGWGDYEKSLYKCDIEKLLNYITNLQQENERLKEWKKDLLNENIELENVRKEAIEYIKENIADIDFVKENYNIENFNDFDISIKNVEDLLSILQNGSDK